MAHSDATRLQTEIAPSGAARGEALRRALMPALVAVTVGALVAGAIAKVLTRTDVADTIWAAGTLVALIPACWWVVAALRRGQLGVDVLAVLSLVGTLAVGEYLAGALIGVMLATGQALESAAQRRATKDLRALLARAPKTARRRTPDGVATVPLDAVMVDDILVVGPGEVVPVDGRIDRDWAVLDESVLRVRASTWSCGLVRRCAAV